MKFGAVLLFGLAFSFPAYAVSLGQKACEVGEVWKVSPSISPRWIERFSASLNFPSEAAFDEFAAATTLAHVAHDLESKTFGEYWIARTLFQAKLYHLAHSAFSAIASRNVSPVEIGIQAAAFQCLAKIASLYPTLQIPETAVNRLVEFPVALLPIENRESIWRAGFYAFKAQLERNEALALKVLARALAGSGGIDALARGLIYQRKLDDQNTVRELARALKTTPRHEIVSKHLDLIYVTLGRAQYALGRFPQAVDAFLKVPKESNYLVYTLADLAWAYLMRKNYKEAIGTAFNLQKSALKTAFSPEAPMVMGMALNEICQYPQAIQSVAFFRKRYEKTYRWLYDWQRSRTPAPIASGAPQQAQAPVAPSINLYKILVTYINSDKKAKKSLPDQVATEWLRSPVFIAAQDEINLLRDEADFIRKNMNPPSESPQTVALRAKEIRESAADLNKKVAEEKKARKKGARFPASLNEKLIELRQQMVDHEARKRALGLWQNMFHNYVARISSIDQQLVEKINIDLGRRNAKMIKDLLRVADNVQMIEIEIYDGAGEDMVWRNAHSDYKEVSDKFKEEAKKNSAAAWDWGKVSLQEEGAEVWEDELGWFRGEINDECSNKNKYLTIKSRE